MPSFSLPYFVGKVPLSDGSWAHSGHCDGSSECFFRSQLQTVQKTQFSSVSEKSTAVKAACKEIHRDLNFFPLHTHFSWIQFNVDRVMHGAYSLHYPVIAFTGHIFIYYILLFQSCKHFRFFFNSHFLVFHYIFDRVYSASFMNPGSLEKNIMKTKA
jgi:hypothetical protein